VETPKPLAPADSLRPAPCAGPIAQNVGQPGGAKVLKSPRPLGRLLEEISWEGNARKYRYGGRGFENVLTAEVFQALDFLPRTAFLGRILDSLAGAVETVKMLAQEVEQIHVSLLPGGMFLAEHPPAGSFQLEVQPDAVIDSPSVYCLLEAKRIRRGAFQPEQLAREYLAVVQQADARRPLLLLILPKIPPVAVSRHGSLEITEAVARWLEPVLARCEHEFPPVHELLTRIESVVAYTTWRAIVEAISSGLHAFKSGDESVDASVARLARAALGAIDWHS
jgi:hypothetical protein